MPADSLHCELAAVELNDALAEGRIDKITMPDPDEIVLYIHAKNNYACILSANPSLPRVHLTKHAPKDNPLTAPAFLMHLRKHINGAVVKRVRAHHGERIILFDLQARNELGYEEKKTLICEVMGKYANIILIGDDGRISECLKHISPATSEKRPILPQIFYTFPPKQQKIDIFDQTALRTFIGAFSGGKLDGYILAGAAGLAPSTIRAVVCSVLGTVFCDALDAQTKDALCTAFDKTALLQNARPCVENTPGEKSDFWLFPFAATGAYTFYPTLNEAMDAYYSTLDADRRLREKAHVPKTAVKNAIARTEKKLKLFLSRKAEASDLERDRLYGELITANIYRIKQGMQSVTLENYYLDPPESVTIPLAENKSPQYNAQNYFKRYAKKKKTLSMVETQIEQAQNDWEYYTSIYDSFAFTDAEGMKEILTELYDAGLLHEPKGKKKKETLSIGGELLYAGCTIRWGKTNLQNDRITKQAKSEDYWLHTQKIHGSHVTVSGSSVTEAVLVRAAEIAAYYSQARLGDNVPVDYTRKKHVSKPKGSPPGKVIYTDYKTVFVTPKSE